MGGCSWGYDWCIEESLRRLSWDAVISFIGCQRWRYPRFQVADQKNQTIEHSAYWVERYWYWLVGYHRTIENQMFYPRSYWYAWHWGSHETSYWISWSQQWFKRSQICTIPYLIRYRRIRSSPFIGNRHHVQGWA